MAKLNFSEMTFEEKKKALLYGGLILVGLILIFYFFGFSYIWNTDFGAEVGVNGYQYLGACLSGTYNGQGSIGWPFYKLAKYFVIVLGIFVTISFFTTLVFALISGIAFKKYNKVMEKLITIFLYILAGLFLACAITALTMNASKIIPKYCSNNPKCSIGTLAFFPFVTTLTMAIVHSVFMHKNKDEFNVVEE